MRARLHGLQIAREIFADRNYLNDGWLVPRTRPDALLHDPKEAAGRVLRMLREGKVRSIEGQDVEVRGETICVHGDTPGAVEFARELRTQLESEGVENQRAEKIAMSNKIETWSRRAPAPKRKPCAARGRADSNATSYISAFGTSALVSRQSDCFLNNVQLPAT